MNKERAKIFFLTAGLLDLFSFFRDYKTGWILVKSFQPDLFWVLHLLLIISLLFSGVLLLLSKKSGLILFYFQYPLKLAFVILTFGFILNMLHPASAMVQKIIYGFLIGLETMRLYWTIRLQRR